MPSWLESWPLVWSFALMFAVVFFRAQATYWVGRSVTSGASRTRWGRYVDSQKFSSGSAAIARWGWPVIPFSFLTVGFQTAVNAAAGLVRMPWRRYTLAMLPGCLAWAAIWSTIGWAAFEASLALASRSPWALVGAVTVAGMIGGAAFVYRRHRRAGPRPGPNDPALATAATRHTLPESHNPLSISSEPSE